MGRCKRNNKISLRGGVELGYYTSSEFHSDLKHFLFRLSRYKFVAKLMRYGESVSVLELGCNEAWGSLLLDQNMDMSKYVGVDFDSDVIEWNIRHLQGKYRFICSDFFECKELADNVFDLIFSLDVIEHIEQEREEEFFDLIVGHLNKTGTAVIGTPSVNMMPYANEAAKAAHINMYDQRRLFDLSHKYFHNVYIFNMNDEVVNTAFDAMACYMFAVCSNPVEST